MCVRGVKKRKEKGKYDNYLYYYIVNMYVCVCVWVGVLTECQL